MHIKDIEENWMLYIPVLLSFGLVLSAYLHKLQLDNPDNYRESILIYIEFAFIIFASIGALVIAVFELIYLIMHKWTKLLHGGISIAITLFLINAGFIIDSTTLVHMT